MAMRLPRSTRLNAHDSCRWMYSHPRDCCVAAAVRGLKQRRDFRGLPHVLVDPLVGEAERCDVAQDRMFGGGADVELGGCRDRGRLAAVLIGQHEKSAGDLFVPPGPILVVAERMMEQHEPAARFDGL